MPTVAPVPKTSKPIVLTFFRDTVYSVHCLVYSHFRLAITLKKHESILRIFSRNVNKES